MSAEKLSIKEKVGFSLGDTAANFIFQTIMLLQLDFYTNSFGISAAAIAALFLIGRLVGAVADPIMGVIADRTNTKWGKFRPWILWTAIPFGIFGFFAFYTPDMGQTGKVIWAFVTYILLMLVYSANNIPYSALSGVITGDQKERNSLFSVRFVFVNFAMLCILGFAKPMVNFFGGGDSAKGYMITMGIFSVLAVIFLLLTFFWTKERIKPNPEQKQSLKQDISDLLNNGPWVTMFVVFLMMFIFLAIRNGMLLFYFNNYLDAESMKNFISGYNFMGASSNAADTIFAITNILGVVASILGIVVSNKMVPKMGKRNVFIVGLVLAMLSVAAFYIVPPTGIAMIFVLQILYNFFWGITMPVPWAMMADVADFSDWKFNRRSTAIVFAGIVIGLKVGLAIGGAVSSMLLSWYGYVAPVNGVAVVQSATAVEGIRLSTSLYPAIAIAIMVVILFFYKITQKVEIQMQDELAERRKAYKG